jgi:hypothetical protein
VNDGGGGGAMGKARMGDSRHAHRDSCIVGAINALAAWCEGPAN